MAGGQATGAFSVHSEEKAAQLRNQNSGPRPSVAEGVQLHAADGETFILALAANLGFDMAVTDREMAFCQSRPPRRKVGPLFVTRRGLGSPSCWIRVCGCTAGPLESWTHPQRRTSTMWCCSRCPRRWKGFERKSSPGFSEVNDTTVAGRRLICKSDWIQMSVEKYILEEPQSVTLLAGQRADSPSLLRRSSWRFARPSSSATGLVEKFDPRAPQQPACSHPDFQQPRSRIYGL